MSKPPVVSIPIILLRRSSIRFSQKVVLGIFMSLSLVMVIIAIVRCAKIYGKDGVDLPWEFFWQCMEANVAVLMSSLTVFRTLLTHESKKRVDDRKRRRAAGPRSNFKSSLSVRVWRILNVKGKPHEDLESQDGLPEIPGATMTGLRTFIRRNQRDGGHTVIDDNMTKTSQTDTLDGRDGTFVYTQEKLSNSDRTDGIWGSQVSLALPSIHAQSQRQGILTTHMNLGLGHCHLGPVSLSNAAIRILRRQRSTEVQYERPFAVGNWGLPCGVRACTKRRYYQVSK